MSEVVVCEQKRDQVWNGFREGLEFWIQAKQNLSLRLHLVTEDKVGGQTQDDEEKLLELTHLPRTLQLWPVHPIDGEDHPFKDIPARKIQSGTFIIANSSVNYLLILSQNLNKTKNLKLHYQNTKHFILVHKVKVLKM